MWVCIYIYMIYFSKHFTFIMMYSKTFSFNVFKNIFIHNYNLPFSNIHNPGSRIVNLIYDFGFIAILPYTVPFLKHIHYTGKIMLNIRLLNLT